MSNPSHYKLERETRFELATSTLARLHSTTELFPLIFSSKTADKIPTIRGICQQKNLTNLTGVKKNVQCELKKSW